MPEPLDVFGWAAGETGCGYYRISEPLEALARTGRATGYGVRMPDHVRESRDTVIVGQRVCKAEPTMLWQILANQGRRLVFEIDDDLWNVDASSPAAFKFFSDPAIQANLQRNIEVASAVTVTTEPLADRIRPWNPNIHVIPNSAPNWLLHHTPPQRNDDILTIGWGGSSTHHMDFEQVAQPLKRFIGRTPGVEFHCIGNNYANWMKIPRELTRFTPWVPDVPTFLRTIDYHIAIAPLRPHVFNQGKSWLKALEVGALGIPIIASAVRPYEDYVQHGVTGFLVRRDHEWAQYLRALTEDPDLRAVMGAAAREQAAQNTIDSNVHLWEKAILG